MTPKEKAEDLLDKMERQTYKYQEYAGAIYKTCEIGYEGGKKCALIAVDEIIKSEPRYPSNVDWDDAGGSFQYYYEAQREEAERYWEEVKKEISDEEIYKASHQEINHGGGSEGWIKAAFRQGAVWYREQLKNKI